MARLLLVRARMKNFCFSFALASLSMCVVACSSSDDAVTPEDTGVDSTTDTAGDTATETAPETSIDETSVDSSSDGSDTETDTGGFPQPSGTVAVSFVVDDSANAVYGDGDLAWKASMKYDATTRKITRDPTWAGPFAPLFDDGPWTAGGHEPIGATAHDHVWGVTVFATPPASGSDAYEYGLEDDVYQTKCGNGWIWSGANGTFTVAAGATAPITATGTTFAKFGTTDLQIVLDTAAVTGTWDKSKISLKGSAWVWSEVELKDDGTKGDVTAGDGKFTFDFSYYVPSLGTQFPHTGLAKSGDKPSFVFVLGTKEYKDASGNSLSTGVSAGTKAAGASSFTAATIMLGSDKSSYVTVP
jgi:hypothetical protein